MKIPHIPPISALIRRTVNPGQTPEPPPPTPREIRIHDYRRRYFGHDYAITSDADPGAPRITGWGDGVRQGDLLLLQTDDGACFYQIEVLNRPGDPGDMWFTRCRFVPASSELGQKAAAALDKPRTFSPISLTSWAVIDA